MLKVYNLKGKNESEIINKFLLQENIKNKDIYIIPKEIETKLFSPKKYFVDVVVKKEIYNFIKEYFQKIAELMKIQITVEINEDKDICNVRLITDNSAILIGKEGKNLDAMQILLRQSIHNQTGLKLKIILDSANYKVNKNRNIEMTIKKIAEEIIKTKLDVKLDPMTSYERRLVHNVINKFSDLTTESIGETPNRYIIIKYKDQL
ncbi:MAG: R3H domain-containing nucleic acid-binding protein [Bacilli bacterium]